jgi:hypothetical protein
MRDYSKLEATKEPGQRATMTDPLFIDDNELRERINPRMGRDRFRAAIKALEADGFPATQKLMGGRYWRAVVAFFDRNHGLSNDRTIDPVQDGPEHF